MFECETANSCCVGYSPSTVGICQLPLPPRPLEFSVMNSSLNRILVLGAGVMGQQIAGHCVIHGKDVRIYDVKPPDRLHPRTREHLATLTPDPSEQQRRRDLFDTLTVTANAQLAADSIDLLIECVPEDIVIKRQVLFQFSRLCPKESILTTNTSAYVPSQLVRVVPQPERFAAMHFFPGCTLGELMGHAQTSDSAIQQLSRFLAEIGHDVAVCRKESSGAIFNAMLMPYMGAAVAVAAKGLAAPDEIDRVWKTVTGAKEGPFEMMDAIGLDTALQITRNLLEGFENPELTMRADFLQQYVDRGWLGIKSGRGFYQYNSDTA